MEMETPEELKARQALREEINSKPRTCEEISASGVRVWTNDQFKTEFESVSFLAPFVYARCKETGETMLLLFQHWPRIYWEAQPIPKFDLTSWAENK